MNEMPVPTTSSDSGPRVDDHYDVVIVGARAAGAATAMLLARHGISVLALDRAAYGSDTMSTHSLAPAGVRQLSRWGLLDPIRAAGTPTVSTVVFHYGADEVRIPVPPRPGMDGLYSPRRTLLDPLLVDAAVDAGAHVRHGVSVKHLTRGSDGRVDGVVADIDGERRRIGARWVVGADGMRSRVAAAVEAREIERAAASVACVYSYWEGLPDDEIVTYYDPASVVGIIPTNGGAVVWAGTRPERFEELGRGNPAALHDTLVAGRPELAEMLQGARRVGRHTSFAGMRGWLREAWGAGWLLVGDSGYFKDPVSAHGITDAFIGAELVADAVADVVAGRAAEHEAFGRYQRLRDGLACRMLPAASKAAALPDDTSEVMAAFMEMNGALGAEWALIDEHFAVAATV